MPPVLTVAARYNMLDSVLRPNTARSKMVTEFESIHDPRLQELTTRADESVSHTTSCQP
jgi:hypothetical protein